MFYVRSPTEGGQEAISEALSILWQVRIHFAHFCLGWDNVFDIHGVIKAHFYM